MLTKVVVPLCLFAALAPLSAQNPPEISYCPAGVHADGFVDWTKLPKPPKSGAVTAAIPVAGIANLSATFYIAGPANPAHNQNPSYYSVENSAALSLPLGVNPTITFSKPVQGIRVSFQTFGRFGHDFKMTASNIAGGTTSLQPPDAQVDSNGGDYPGQQLSSAPLQIRSTSADLVSVAFQFTGDPVDDIDFQLINLRIESGSAVDPATQVPKNGLKEWLRGDRVNALGPTNSGNVISWPDQSGNGSDALPPEFRVSSDNDR